MKKRVVYMLLCFMLCMASIPAAAFADSETPAVPATKWSDNAATAFAGGSGTEADPYQIETAEQLQNWQQISIQEFQNWITAKNISS